MSNPPELHWYGTQHTNCDPFRSVFNAAATEKEDLMCLNNRLADVFTRLDKLGGGEKTDITAFLKAIECLKEEIKKIRICYENELSKTRRELELLIAEKNEMLANFADCKMCYETLQNKYDDAMRENNKLNDDIHELKCYTAQKEREMADLTNCMHSIKSELELMRPKCCKYEHDSECYRKQWECERRQRQEADDKNCQLVEKLNFETRMNEQHIRDLEDRLENAMSMIDCLNKKIKELSQGSGGSNINELLQKVREQMMAEFIKYKKDTEEAVNKALTEMKADLERSQREKERLAEERDQMACTVSRLHGQLTEIQGQLCSASTCNQQLQQTLQCEKAQACRAIRDLDCKVLGLQDSIMLKVREVSAAREVQTCLQSEIESYKMLLEREEKKLNKTCMPSVKTSCGSQHPMHAPQGGHPTGAPPPFAGGCGGGGGGCGGNSGGNNNCGGSRSSCGGGAPACAPGPMTNCTSLLTTKQFGRPPVVPEFGGCKRIQSTSRAPIPIAGKNRCGPGSRPLGPIC